MTTSDASWSHSLRQIGELERGDHWYLRDTDQCYFFGEYTAYAGFGHSQTNQLIVNLKKKPSLRDTPQWAYKTEAIRRVASSIAANIKPELLGGVTFVPIPPSKPQTSPDYDDRMAQVARSIGPACDVRELLFTQVEREAFHTSSSRRDPCELRQTLGLRTEEFGAPTPSIIMLLDDVLTTGCSYVTCRDILAEVFPNASIFGLFVARRVVDRSAGLLDLDAALS